MRVVLNAPRDPSGELRAFFERVARRKLGLTLLQTATVGLWIASATLLIVGIPAGRVATGMVVAAAITTLAGLVAVMTPRSRWRAAADVERAAPECRNLLVTTAEILDEPRVPAYVRRRIFGDAMRLTNRLNLRALFPHRRSVIAFASGVAVCAAALLFVPQRTAAVSSMRPPGSERAAAIADIDVEVVPPEYTGQPALTFRNPVRVDALEGSRLRVRIDADAASVSLETLAGTQPVTAAGARTFTASIVAENDGFLAITPTSANGSHGLRRLIGLAVTPDARPRVRATAPGKDLLVASGQQTVPLALDADDDLGLASLELRYTKVSGSGETFTFTDGAVPLDITRTTDRAWTAHASWRLEGLGLLPGDMVIYRGVAADRRPGAPPGESESFVIEIAAPGALASEGFAVDDRMDKYGISQQMVILKTERLIAGRASMSSEAVREAAMNLAADQRQVRAEFVFMLGGELTDAGLDPTTLNEEVEAAGEDDLAAGRLVNQGRADLMRAIRAMSRAAATLTELKVPAALPIEKEALVYLQRAFSRSRYILRTLSERERIDLSRRLTGTLAALARPSRPAAESSPNPRVNALRQVLAAVAALASASDGATAAAMSRAASLAQRLLEIDATSPALREIAEMLSSPPPTDAVARLDRAALSLANVIRTEIEPAPARAPDPEAAALAGALSDARRSRGGGR